MDQSKVEEIVDREIGRYIKLFGLTHWNINWDCNEDNPETPASNFIDPDYFLSCIGFNPAKLRDEEDVIVKLRHELFHLVLSPFLILTQSIAQLNLPNSTHALIKAMDVTAEEQTICNLERIWTNALESNNDIRLCDQPC